MDVKVPQTARTHQVPIGSLFVLVHSSKGNAICIRATYDASSDDEEDHRIVPLHWPEEESSVGVPIYLSALNEDAVVLNDARLEVETLSAKQPSGSFSDIYCREGRLFFPLRDGERIGGLVDVATGEIQDGTKGRFLAFEEWYITIEDSSSDRELIHAVESEGSRAP